MKSEIEKVIPLLKWVGGKRELLPELRKFYHELEFNKYYEPFFGGGSVYLDIIKTFGITLKIFYNGNYLGFSRE
jgi:site-specific DNA-adenine methylase